MNTTQSISVSVAGVDFGGVTSIDFDTALVKEEVLAPGVTGTLATRTGDSAGTITLPSGHGLTTGRFDLYWALAGVDYYQQGLTGTVSGNTMTLEAVSGGNGGTALPVATTAITASPAASFAMAIPTSDLTGFFFKTTSPDSALVRVVVDSGDTYGYLCLPRSSISWVKGTSATPIGYEWVSFFASTKGTTAGGIAAAAIWSD